MSLRGKYCVVIFFVKDEFNEIKKCIWAAFELADYRKTQIHGEFLEVFLGKENIEIQHRLSTEYI